MKKLLYIFILMFGFPCLASADWPADGLPVCNASGNQLYPASIYDGTGGAIIAWFGNGISGLRPVWLGDAVSPSVSPRVSPPVSG